MSAARCHGVGLPLDMKAQDGRPFVAGRRITGFANCGEAATNAPLAIDELVWQFVVLSGRVLEDYLQVNANTPQGVPLGARLNFAFS